MMGMMDFVWILDLWLAKEPQPLTDIARKGQRRAMDSGHMEAFFHILSFLSLWAALYPLGLHMWPVSVNGSQRGRTTKVSLTTIKATKVPLTTINTQIMQ